MPLSDLLVHVDKTSDSVIRLHLAVDLAARHGAVVTALFVRERTDDWLTNRKAAEFGLGSGTDVVDALDRRSAAELAHSVEELKLTLEALAHEHGVATHWRFAEGPASAAVAQHARYADLCLVGHYREKDGDPNAYTFTERLMFGSGRPVLSVPSHGRFISLGRHVTIAWGSSRAASRSLNDALPLIERAERATVLTVNADDFIRLHGGLPAEEMVKHLTHHHVKADLVQLTDIPAGAIAQTLQAKAREIGADLLVAGAFGHPRHWERLLGGVTRGILDYMHLPTLMSN